MKKIIAIIIAVSVLSIGVIVFAQQESSHVILPVPEEINSTSTTSTPPAGTSTKIMFRDPACIATAINTRENAIITAMTLRNDNIEGALRIRKAALAETMYVSSVKELRAKINKARNDFNKTRNAEIKKYKQSVQTTWNTYKAAKKLCANANLYNYNDSGSADLGL